MDRLLCNCVDAESGSSRADMCGPLQYRTWSQAEVGRVPTVTSSPGGSAVLNAVCSGQSPPALLLEHFFDLPDLFFNFAGGVFGFAFSL